MIFPVRCLEREPRRCVLQMTAEEAPPPGSLTLQAFGIVLAISGVVGGTLFPILAEELVFVVAGIITFYLFALPMLIPFYRAITLEHTFFLGLDTLAKFEFNEFHMPFNFTGPGSRVDIEEIPASEVEKSRREERGYSGRGRAAHCRDGRGDASDRGDATRGGDRHGGVE